MKKYMSTWEIFDREANEWHNKHIKVKERIIGFIDQENKKFEAETT